MKKFTYCFLFFMVGSSITFGQTTKVIGYVPTWGNFTNFTQNLDYKKVSHLNLSFANPNGAGYLDEGLSDLAINNFISKAHSEGVLVLISLGGATASDAWDTLVNAANRVAFIDKIMVYVAQYNFDGIDMDLEGSKITSDYDDFVTALSIKTQAQGLLLTAAVASWNGSAITNQALSAFDFINLMAYDATGPWNLNNPGQHSSMAFAQSDLNYWVNRGVAPQNCVLGVPFYGYDFGNSGLGTKYSSIVAQNASYAYQDQVGQLYYNGKNTIGAKTTLAVENYGGIMIWELTQDSKDETSLLDTIYNNIMGKNLLIGGANRPPQISMLSPFNGQVVAQGLPVTVEANVFDTDGTVAEVYFVLNGDTIQQFAGGTQFNFQTSALQAGNYEIYAIAKDNDGAERVSTIIAFKVEISSPEIMVINPIVFDTLSLGRALDIQFQIKDSLFNITNGGVIWMGDTLLNFDTTGVFQISSSNSTYGLNLLTIFAANTGGGLRETVIPVYVVEAQSPYNITPITLPGKVEAEQYDKGGYLVSYYDTDTANHGGTTLRNDAMDVENYASGKYNLGYLKPGEWTKYAIEVLSEDTFKVMASVASIAPGGAFELYIDGVLAVKLTSVKNTGGWTTFQEVELGQTILTTGIHELKFLVTKDEFNLDYLLFTDDLSSTSVKRTEKITFQLYPNPAQEQISLTGLEGTFYYQITSLEGKNWKSGDSTLNTINISDLPRGIYLITVRQNENFGQIKWIKL